MEACHRSPRSRLELYSHLLRQARWTNTIGNDERDVSESTAKKTIYPRRGHHGIDRHFVTDSQRRFPNDKRSSPSVISYSPSVPRSFPPGPIDETSSKYRASAYWGLRGAGNDIQDLQRGEFDVGSSYLLNTHVPPMLSAPFRRSDCGYGPPIARRPLPVLPDQKQYQVTPSSSSANRPADCEDENDKKRPATKTFEEAFSVAPSQATKRTRKSNALDILVSATLELGPLRAIPTTGCSCPRSNCIKLYCDCFKAGSKCSNLCSCINCKNTEEETHINGERIQAIKNTLARNPRAFTGGKKEAVPCNPGDIVCNCVKSRCLKLYCNCFHAGKTCNSACLCVGCLNTQEESTVGGERIVAIQNCLEKRPDAFVKKPKIVGAGCACKNNRCLKKYCDCFRFDLPCTNKCTCRECGNAKA